MNNTQNNGGGSISFRIQKSKWKVLMGESKHAWKHLEKKTGIYEA